MIKAEVKEEDPDGHLVDSAVVSVKEEPSDHADETVSDNEVRNTSTNRPSPSSDRQNSLQKRTRTSKRIRKEDAGTMEPTVNSSNVEGEWTEMESVVIDEEPPLAVKAESPSIWEKGVEEQGSSKDKTLEQGTSRNPRRRGRRSKDEQLAAEYALPASAEELVAMTYHEVQRFLCDHKLSNAQKALIRKIRRRGRNKVAAQKCRERRAQDRHAPIAHAAQSPYRDDNIEEKCAAKLAL